MAYRGKVEFAQQRKIRERNTNVYRLCHWPIWIWVFFLAPGPLTFSLFAHGFSWPNGLWLAAVLVGTGIAGLRGKLPGAEPRPYILRFDEDRPNPLYRRVCYTFAWSAVITFASLNLAGLVGSAVTGVWYMKQLYAYAYFPLCALILLLGLLGKLPLFLWFRLGGHRRSNAASRPVEDRAPHRDRQPPQAVRVSCRPALHGTALRARQALPHTAHPARRGHGRIAPQKSGVPGLESQTWDTHSQANIARASFFLSCLRRLVPCTAGLLRRSHRFIR